MTLTDDPAPAIARDALRQAAARVAACKTDDEIGPAILDLAVKAEDYGAAIYYASEDVSSGDVYASIALAVIYGATGIR